MKKLTQSKAPVQVALAPDGRTAAFAAGVATFTVYDLETFVYRKGVTGPKPFAFEAGNATIDIQTWTMD